MYWTKESGMLRISKITKSRFSRSVSSLSIAFSNRANRISLFTPRSSETETKADWRVVGVLWILASGIALLMAPPSSTDATGVCRVSERDLSRRAAFELRAAYGLPAGAVHVEQ